MTQQCHNFFTFILLIFIPANFLFPPESHPAHKEWERKEKRELVCILYLLYTRNYAPFTFVILFTPLKRPNEIVYAFFLLPLKQIRHREVMSLFSAAQLMIGAVGICVPDCDTAKSKQHIY